jgi:hypothetical protein
MLKHKARDFQCSSTKQETSHKFNKNKDMRLTLDIQSEVFTKYNTVTRLNLENYHKVSKCLIAFEFDRGSTRSEA